VDDALKMLNLDKNASLEAVDTSFKHIYEANAPEKGNSFYLQSKVYRAHETLVAALKQAEQHDDSDLRPPGDAESNVKDKQ
jgi:import inner membrane translocase subunit TIM16